MTARLTRRHFLALFAILGGLICIPVIVLSAEIRERGQNRFGDLTEGFNSFPGVPSIWGMENLSFLPSKDKPGKYMRVFIPRGAIDPSTMMRRGLRPGGVGFKSKVFNEGVNHAVLSYWVRFPEDFDFVRGGKLPGLYGGRGNSGGKIPDGTDGFSFRLMWGKNGVGGVYAYLPTSANYGTGFLHLNFQRGRWHQIVQELILNDPGEANGVLRMWMDGSFIGEEQSLLIRTVNNLRINGMFFDVFFGGNNDSWAPSTDTYIDFRDLAIRGYGG